MKYIITFYLLLFTSTIINSQIITVTINESYEYEHKPESYNISITEILESHRSSKEDIKERETNFRSKINTITKYFEENNIVYNEVRENKVKKNNLPEGAIALNHIKFELSTKREEIEKIEKLVNNLEKLHFINQDLFISVDEAFLKKCLVDLETKAHKKAYKYAIALELKLSGLHEIKIIKHKVNKLSNNRLRSSGINKKITHTAIFEVEYSFDTMGK